jgi:hypothetical protein
MLSGQRKLRGRKESYRRPSIRSGHRRPSQQCRDISILQRAPTCVQLWLMARGCVHGRAEASASRRAASPIVEGYGCWRFQLVPPSTPGDRAQGAAPAAAMMQRLVTSKAHGCTRALASTIAWPLTLRATQSRTSTRSSVSDEATVPVAESPPIRVTASIRSAPPLFSPKPRGHDELDSFTQVRFRRSMLPRERLEPDAAAGPACQPYSNNERAPNRDVRIHQNQ